MNELITLNEANIPTYNSKELNAATRKVFSLGEKIRKSALETAAVVAAVDKTGCYKDDGFKTVHDWTAAAFGFKKSTSYNMLAIGKEYVAPVLNSAGRTIAYESTFAQTVESEGDFTVTQLIQLLPAGRDMAGQLVLDGKVSPGMTCKAIKAVVDAARADEEEDEDETAGAGETGENEDETAGSGETGENEDEEEQERRTATVDIITGNSECGGFVYVNFGELTYKFTLKEWVDHCTAGRDNNEHHE
jgi:hypothetical protein